MSGWALFVYCYNRWAHLRFFKTAFFTTHKLDVVVTYAWAVPLSVVAAAWAVWGLRWRVSWLMSLGSYAPLLAFAASAVFWIFCYSLFQPFDHEEPEEREKVDFEEAEEDLLYTWFNVNPIYVLKCAYVPDLVGKDHPYPVGADR